MDNLEVLVEINQNTMNCSDSFEYVRLEGIDDFNLLRTLYTNTTSEKYSIPKNWNVVDMNSLDSEYLRRVNFILRRVAFWKGAEIID